MTRRHRDALREPVYRAEREWRAGPVTAYARGSADLWLGWLCYLTPGFAAHDLPWLNTEAVRLLALPAVAPLHGIPPDGLTVRWADPHNHTCSLYTWQPDRCPAHVLAVNPIAHRLAHLDHEMAHALVAELWGCDAAAHGCEFCAVRVHLARLRVGDLLAAPLRAAFEAFCGPLEAWPIATPP